MKPKKRKPSFRAIQFLFELSKPALTNLTL